MFYKIIYLLIMFTCFVNIKITYTMDWNNGDKEETACPDELGGRCNNKEYRDFYNIYNILFNKTNINHKLKQKKSTVSPQYDTTNIISCQCEMSYRIMDLGSGIYPRYIPTGVCKKNACGLFHRCQPKKYKIRLLKRKDPDVIINDAHLIEESFLPQSLTQDWISDHVNIVIGCDCTPVKI